MTADSSTVPCLLPLLPADRVHAHGNARCDKAGRLTAVHEGSRLPRAGRRRQHKNVIFHADCPGFDPYGWQHVCLPPWLQTKAPSFSQCANNEFRLNVAASSTGEPSSLVYVWYPTTKCTGKPQPWHHELKMVTRAAIMATRCNRKVRTTDGGVGHMTGIGEHLYYDGFIGPYKPVKLLDGRKRTLGSVDHQRGLLQQAASLLEMLKGKDIGAEGLLSGEGQVLSEKGFVKYWCQASSGLVNGPHCDIKDAGRSIAQWCRERNELSEPKHWWLLFPDVGLAVRLCHGAVVSWDGRYVRHCTTLSGTDERDDYLSLFFGRSGGVDKFKRQQEEWLESYQEGGSHAWDVGDVVWVRCWKKDVPGTSWRRRTGDVLHHEVGVSVTIQFSAVEESTLEGEAYLQDVVRAGFARRCDVLCEELVGSRVRVFWPDEDSCFDGRVQGFNNGRHLIVYDDGDMHEELLGGEDAPYYRQI